MTSPSNVSMDFNTQRNQANSSEQSITKKKENADKLINKFHADKKGSRHTFISSDGQYIYHVGIIDYL
jgi:hypothetical protein